MSNSFTNQCLAQIDMTSNTYAPGVYQLSKVLDEEVARLHLNEVDQAYTKTGQLPRYFSGRTIQGRLLSVLSSSVRNSNEWSNLREPR